MQYKVYLEHASYKTHSSVRIPELSQLASAPQLHRFLRKVLEILVLCRGDIMTKTKVFFYQIAQWVNKLAACLVSKISMK